MPVAVWDSRETEAAVMSALGAAITEEKVRLGVGLSAHEAWRVILLHFAVT